MDNAMAVINQILALLGFLLRALGFGIFGFGATRFALNAYEKGGWQVQVALALGLFAMTVGLTKYATPGSAGAFALGAAIAFFMVKSAKTEE